MKSRFEAGNKIVAYSGEENPFALYDIIHENNPLFFSFTDVLGPRTPTPFKDALAAMGKKRRGGKYVPPSPSSLVEDIAEMIADDSRTEKESNTSGELNNDSMRSGGQQKRARKSLAASWSNDIKQEPQSEKKAPYETETPSKFLNSVDSAVFSPPSVLKETLTDSDLMLNYHKENYPNSAKKRAHLEQKLVIDANWLKYACGKTEDQSFMTNEARHFLERKSLAPRSLNFFGGTNT